MSTPINEGARGYYSLMQHDYIVLPLKLKEPVDFKIGSYVDLRGVFDDALGGKLAKIYYVTESQNPTYNTSTGAYEYQLRLNAYYWLWNNFIFKYTPESTAGEASWSLTAPLDVQMGVFLRNLSELGFTYNGVPYEISIDSTVEDKAVAMRYDNTHLLDALFSMGGENAWNCDVWITENVIHFGRCEHGDAVKIEIGVEASDMTRNESKGTFATRIYAFGSTRNIPENYRPDTNEDLTVNGIVQKRLMLPEDTPCIDAYPDMHPFEVVEAVVVFDDIYPKRIGTLSDVQTVDRAVTGDNGEQTGTFKAYQYKDSGITFDESYRIADQDLRIVFQSGKLNGLDFVVQFNPNNSDPAEQLWEIVANEDYGRRLPDEVMKPENGDKYILYGFDIKLVSDQYIPQAEQELKERAEDYVNMTKVDDGTYTVPLRASYVREDMISRTYDVGQKVNLVNPFFFGTEGRISRVIGWEMCLDIPSDNPVYTIGESAQYSRLTEIEDKVDSLVFNGQTYQGTGGGGGLGVYIIKTNDSTPASDTNVLSALRSLATFLRKDKADSTEHLISFLGGLTSDNIESLSFASGPFGTGFIIKRDPKTGRSYIETDELYVRLKAYFDTLEIKHLSHVGGRIVASPAGMECVKVETVSAEYESLYDKTGSPITDSGGEEVLVPSIRGEQAYRCYFKQTDGSREIVNEFAVDDLAQCREFNVKTGVSHNVSNRYYWRRVVGLGDDYIDLSVTDCDDGSMDPEAGDTIVTIGNKSDTSRQHVVFLSSYDDDAPSIKLYSGIDSYSTLGKEVTVVSPNADKNVFTGRMVIKSGSSGFRNLTDAPDMEGINREIQNAKDDASSASQAASEIQQAVSDLSGYVDGAFADGIISEAEAKAISTYINTVDNEKKSAEATYSELYNNPYLGSTAKVGLANAKEAMFSAAEALTNSVNTAIADGRTTAAEKEEVDIRYASFNTACASFNEAVQASNKAIQDKLKGYSTNAQKAADEAARASMDAMEKAAESAVQVSDLSGYVDGAFADGIISEAEARSIEKYLNVIDSTRNSVESTYSGLYGNVFLSGTAKTSLYSSKTVFDNALSGLADAINAAISDGIVSEEEKRTVNSRFSAFNTACSSFFTAVQNATSFIQKTIKDQAVNEARSDIDSKVGEVEDSVKEEIARRMGYKDYSELVYYAEKGQTVIAGGHINTQLIEAALLVTSQVIANAIKANILNVNDNFVIYTDGTVKMKGDISSYSEEGSMQLSEGALRLLYNEPSMQEMQELVRISAENESSPEVFVRNSSNKIVSITPTGFYFSNAPMGTSLRLDTELLGSGVVRKTADGMLYISEDETVKYRIVLNGSAGGTTSPSPGTYYKNTGEIMVVTAVPSYGYEFDKWSDGGARQHTVTADSDKTLTAYFKTKPKGQYTLSLYASPSGGGTVSGAGTYDEGEIVNVNAKPASDYRFVRWSDGLSQYHSVRMDSNKSLTAYFERVSSVSGELFLGTDLMDGSYWGKSGNDSYIVINGMAMLMFVGDISGDSHVSFNKGSLYGKLKKGERYMLRMTAYSSKNEAALMAVIGQSLVKYSAIVFYGAAVNNGVTSTEETTYNAEFTMNADATVNDGLLITANDNCYLMVKSISLVKI